MSLEPLPEPDPAGAGTPVSGDLVRGDDHAVVAGRIAAERAALGRTVEELAARLDWKGRLRQQLAQTSKGISATAGHLWRRLRRST